MRFERIPGKSAGLLLVAAGLFLAGCASSGDTADATPPSAIASSEARLLTDPEPVVEVTIRLGKPDQSVDEVVLLSPDGARTPAVRYDSTKPPATGGSPRFGVVIGSRTGVGLSVPIEGNADKAGDLVVARIPVADIESYRATRADWRIELAVLDARGNRSIATIPAP